MTATFIFGTWSFAVTVPWTTSSMAASGDQHGPWVLPGLLRESLGPLRRQPRRGILHEEQARGEAADREEARANAAGPVLKHQQSPPPGREGIPTTDFESDVMVSLAESKGGGRAPM